MGEEADWLMDRAMLDHDTLEDEGVVVEGKVLGPNTVKAILLLRKADGLEHWIPRSQIYHQEEDGIIISTWLADKKGWLEEDEDLDKEIPF